MYIRTIPIPKQVAHFRIFTIYRSTNPDQFIIEYNKNNNNKVTYSLLDNRRVIFISFVGLFNTFDQCPAVVLYSCLCVMPIKKKWIYQSLKHFNEINTEYEVFAPFDKVIQYIRVQKLQLK